MKKLLIVLFLFVSYKSYAVSCADHPIYCQIIKNSPKINKKHAMRVSNIIYKMHKKYHIPSRIFAAILAQESGYQLKAKGCHWGYNIPSNKEIQQCIDGKYNKPYNNFFRNELKHKCKKQLTKETKICTDFGIAQLYYRTAKRYQLDIDLLTSDLEYSIEAGAIVLSGFMKKYEARENDWWVRYNCGNSGSVKRDTCQIYKKLVERYL